MRKERNQEIFGIDVEVKLHFFDKEKWRCVLLFGWSIVAQVKGDALIGFSFFLLARRQEAA